jgi:hypothetical protein
MTDKLQKATAPLKSGDTKGLDLTGLYCKSCGAPIEEDDINLDLAMAKCSYCGAVFGVKGLPLQKDRDAPLRYERPEVPMPTGIEVTRVGDALQISRRWCRWPPLCLFLLLLCLGCDAVLIMIIFGNGGMPVTFPYITIAIGMTYGTLARFLDRITVQVKQGQLKIRQRPLPCGHEKCLSATDIEQIYCKESILSRSYEAYAVLRRGRKIKLLSNLPKPEQALYIEQELERSLGIQDRPVHGETPR